MTFKHLLQTSYASEYQHRRCCFHLATLLPYPFGKEDLGQRFCVPAFRLVCLFQADGIIGTAFDNLKFVFVIAMLMFSKSKYLTFQIKEMIKVTYKRKTFQ
jgi:hypothetical protein